MRRIEERLDERGLNLLREIWAPASFPRFL
jgi:hypothetical protein